MKQERDARELDQAEFGALGDVKRNTQLAYEKGERAPGADYLLHLEQAGVDVGYILTGKRTSDSLSADESELLHAYRGTHALCKGAILLLARHANDEDTSDNVRHILRDALAR